VRSIDASPTPLAPDHDLSRFDSGVAALDDWLRSRARRNEKNMVSRTYVVAHANVVVGFYSLSAASIALTNVPRSLSRNKPDPLPVVLMGRLAVHQSEHGQGVGRGLLKDALDRTLSAAEIIGVRGLLVHAISEQAKAFYERFGFVASPVQPLSLISSSDWLPQRPSG
jgi:GNAT superfamily N-acetyltransferase